MSASSPSGVEVFDERMRDDQRNYLELALDYAAAGLYRWAVGVLQQYLQRVDQRPETAIVFYFLADWHDKVGDHERPQVPRHRSELSAGLLLSQPAGRNRGAAASRDGQPGGREGAYYLGNLWYDRRQYDLAMSCWERSRDRDPSLATVWRNLGLAYFNKRHARMPHGRLSPKPFDWIRPTRACCLNSIS